MKKNLFMLLACFTTTLHSYADNFCCTDCFGFDSVLTFDVGGGYRNDNLKWTAYPESSPGVKLQEKWKNVGLGIIDSNAQFLVCDHLLFIADFDYGWFRKSGHQTIKEHTNGDLTTDLSSPVKGNVYDLSGAIGYQFNLDCVRMALAPLAGYSYHQQRFKNRDYTDKIERSEDTFFAHNSYNYRWSGPWLGVAMAFQPCYPWQLYFDYAFHWVWFRGSIKERFFHRQPEIRLRSKECHGNEFTAGAIYNFCDGWYLGFKYNYKEFFGNKGHYEPEVNRDDVKSPLRDIRWNSYSITANIGYNF